MTSVQSSHALPPAPAQQQYQSQNYQQNYQQQYQQQPQSQQSHSQKPVLRERSKSSFSFRSHKSNGSEGKIDLVESPKEKRSRRLSTKADPRLAISEAEPSAVANSSGSQLAPLRAIQHKDAQGNAIADPDRSNPTRSRWERPLDTIRSFEAAIDGNYNRKSYMRAESSDGASAMNRRSSYMAGGSNVGSMTPRYPQDGYYAGRGGSYRQDSYSGRGGGSRPESYYDHSGDHAGPSNSYYPNRARYPRTASEPMLNKGNTVYPVQEAQQSYETVTTSSGSSGEPLGYSTDPSSENSSVDRVAAGEYAYGGPAAIKPPMHSFSNSYGGYPGGHSEMPTMYEGQQGQGPPPVPRKQNQPARAPIKLGSGGGGGGGGEPTVYEPPKPEKRKSWLGRKFSKG